MIKHIVLWKVRDDDQKQKNIDQMIQSLTSLVGKIEGLVGIEMGYSFNENSEYDVALYATFKNPVALKYYQNHPEHVKCKDFISKITVGRTAVDYFYEKETTAQKDFDSVPDAPELQTESQQPQLTAEKPIAAPVEAPLPIIEQQPVEAVPAQPTEEKPSFFRKNPVKHEKYKDIWVCPNCGDEVPINMGTCQKCGTPQPFNSASPTIPEANPFASFEEPKVTATPAAEIKTEEIPIPPAPMSFNDVPPPPPAPMSFNDVPPPPAPMSFNDVPPPPPAPMSFNDVPPPPPAPMSFNDVPTPPPAPMSFNDVPPPPPAPMSFNDVPPPPPAPMSFNDVPPPPPAPMSFNDIPTPPPAPMSFNDIPTPPPAPMSFNDIPTPPPAPMKFSDEKPKTKSEPTPFSTPESKQPETPIAEKKHTWGKKAKEAEVMRQAEEAVKNRKDVPSSGTWTCPNCGKVMPKYVGTCGCGETQPFGDDEPAVAATSAPVSKKAEQKTAPVPAVPVEKKPMWGKKAKEAEVMRQAEEAVKNRKDVPSSGTWTCPNCGKVMPKYVGTCGCGERQPFEFDDEPAVNTTPVGKKSETKAAPAPSVSAPAEKKPMWGKKAKEAEVMRQAEEAVKNRKDVPSSGTWTCPNCGKVMPKYVGTCGCGERQPFEFDNQPAAPVHTAPKSQSKPAAAPAPTPAPEKKPLWGKKAKEAEVMRQAEEAVKNRKDVPSAGTWTCPNCGKVMPKYVGTCGCGERQPLPFEDEPAPEPTPAPIKKTESSFRKNKKTAEAQNITPASENTALPNLNMPENNQENMDYRQFDNTAPSIQSYNPQVPVPPTNVPQQDLSFIKNDSDTNAVNSAPVSAPKFFTPQNALNQEPQQVNTVDFSNIPPAAPMSFNDALPPAPMRFDDVPPAAPMRFDNTPPPISMSANNTPVKPFGQPAPAAEPPKKQHNWSTANTTPISKPKLPVQPTPVAPSAAPAPEKKPLWGKKAKEAEVMRQAEEAVRNRKDVPNAGTWTCPNCGKVMPTYVGTCGCGESKPLPFDD